MPITPRRVLGALTGAALVVTAPIAGGLLSDLIFHLTSWHPSSELPALSGGLAATVLLGAGVLLIILQVVLVARDLVAGARQDPVSVREVTLVEVKQEHVMLVPYPEDDDPRSVPSLLLHLPVARALYESLGRSRLVRPEPKPKPETAESIVGEATR